MTKVKMSDLYDIGSSKRVFQSEWRESGIPFYRAREIAKLSSDGYVDNELFIDEELYEEYIGKYGKPEAGDIMVTGVGTLGVCYIVKEDDRFYFKDGNILWFRQKAKDRILPEYLVKAFGSNDVKEFIKKNSSGTTVGTFTIQTANKMEISLPTLSEQKEFVSKISKVEQIIKHRKQQLIELDALIKARFVEMFGDQSENQHGYKVCKLSDVAEIYLGLTHTPIYVQHGRPFLSVRDISSGKIDFSNCHYISEDEFLSLPNGARPQVGDLLFCRVGTIGKPVIIPENIPEFGTFVSVGFLRKKSEVLNVYLKSWMEDPYFMQQVMENVAGASQINLNTGWLKNFRILIPPLELQQEFEDFVTQVDKSKAVVQKAIDEAKVLFDSLMQEYFG